MLNESDNFQRVNVEYINRIAELGATPVLLTPVPGGYEVNGQVAQHVIDTVDGLLLLMLSWSLRYIDDVNSADASSHDVSRSSDVDGDKSEIVYNDAGSSHVPHAAARELLETLILPWAPRFLTLFAEGAESEFYEALGQLSATTLNDWAMRFKLQPKEVQLYR